MSTEPTNMELFLFCVSNIAPKAVLLQKFFDDKNIQPEEAALVSLALAGMVYDLMGDEKQFENEVVKELIRTTTKDLYLKRQRQAEKNNGPVA